MDQYLLIPFLMEWTSIYQLFWCSPGVHGFDTLPYPFGGLLKWSWATAITQDGSKINKIMPWGTQVNSENLHFWPTSSSLNQPPWKNQRSSTPVLAMSKEVDRPSQCLPHGHRDSDDDGKEAPYVPRIEIIYDLRWCPQSETPKESWLKEVNQTAGFNWFDG